jgi:hypothetical protein
VELLQHFCVMVSYVLLLIFQSFVGVRLAGKGNHNGSTFFSSRVKTLCGFFSLYFLQ